MHALISLAAESSTSKVPFYVLGGCFAAWAVLISILGMRRADFPSGTLQMRLVMVLTVLLAAGVITAAIVTA